MKIGIIIPAHNEEFYIVRCLESFISQTVRPDKLIVVNDTSTDATAETVSRYIVDHPWINLVHLRSVAEHQPGAKVVEAFNYGYSRLGSDFDLVGKFDADIILPPNYLEKILAEFRRNPRLGLCSGLLYIKKGEQWEYEAISDKSHVRGPIKLYRQQCLSSMNGLRPGLGWDTADEILAQFYGFDTKTLPELLVKHLRPTGSTYLASSSKKQGQAYYNLRYGFTIAFLAALKMASIKRSWTVLKDSMRGYIKAKRSNTPAIVNSEEGRFIRKFRWKNIRKNLF